LENGDVNEMQSILVMC
jgi:hypothetical protein